MASNNKSSGNKIMVPGARAAMEKFKMEAANEVGVELKKGYNGALTSREAGSIGGQMVKNACHIRTFSCKRASRIRKAHEMELKYIVNMVI